jgi:hypothetical protein
MARPLSQIASEISRDWRPVNYAAKPYLDAMYSLDSVKDNYGMDSGYSIVAYFLSNATTWRGETAKRIKTELKAMLKSREGVEGIVNGLLAEGRDITYRYALLWNTPGYHVTPMAWKPKEYGKPNDANLARYMQATLKQMEPGGANAHLAPMKITSAEIRDGIGGSVVARWTP